MVTRVWSASNTMRAMRELEESGLFTVEKTPIVGAIIAKPRSGRQREAFRALKMGDGSQYLVRHQSKLFSSNETNQQQKKAV